MIKKIFIIAGEPSGDALGGSLMQSLRAQNSDLEIAGIGGDKMQEQGLKSLYPMQDLCVMGLVEVIAHLPRLLKLIAQVVEDIEKFDPDVVITIDLPDFNFRVGQALKKRGHTKAKIIHYGAPTVWAWRPGRAQKVAKFLDGLLCLYPFEPPYFEAHGLKAPFVGHPLVENKIDADDRTRFRTLYEIPDETFVLGFFMGSRQSEIARMAPLFNDIAGLLTEVEPSVNLLIPTLPERENQVRNLVSDFGLQTFVVSDPAKKWGAFQACDGALAVSGTVALELAYIGVPHMIAYKMNPLSWQILKLMVKVKHAHLANIMLEKTAVPEFIQGDCDPAKVGAAVLKLIRDQTYRENQTLALQSIGAMLGAGNGHNPSEKAAAFILEQ